MGAEEVQEMFTVEAMEAQLALMDKRTKEYKTLFTQIEAAKALAAEQPTIPSTDPEELGPLVGEEVDPVVDAKPAVHYDLLMGLRLLQGGPFPGLWEPVDLEDTPTGLKVKRVLSDANTKGMCAQLGYRTLAKYFRPGKVISAGSPTVVEEAKA